MVTRATLKDLKQQNKVIFKLNFFEIQMMGHFETMKRGEQGVSDVEKVM